MGATRLANDALYGVFVDARDLGAEIAFIRRESCTANIRDLLAQADVRHCDGLLFSVHGAELYMPGTGTVTFGHRTVLTVKVDTTGSITTLLQLSPSRQEGGCRR